MNNQKTLKKILEELQKDKPRIDYVVGMLEVLIDEPEYPLAKPQIPLPSIAHTSNEVKVFDEIVVLDKMTKTAMEKMLTTETE